MVTFFKKGSQRVIAVESDKELSEDSLSRLSWLFDGATAMKSRKISGKWIGPRVEMITPWSTNAVEITQNMGIDGITRIEEYFKTTSEQPEYDRMLQRLYPDGLTASIFTTTRKPEEIIYIF